MKFPDFPDIVINGKRLSVAQIMTVYVAIQNLAMDCSRKRPPVGKDMAKSYLKNISEINSIMIP